MLQQRLGAIGVGNKKPIFVRTIGIVNAERLPAPAKIQPAFACNRVGKIACWQRWQAHNLPQQAAWFAVDMQAEKMTRAVWHDDVNQGLGHFDYAELDFRLPFGGLEGWFRQPENRFWAFQAALFITALCGVFETSLAQSLATRRASVRLADNVVDGFATVSPLRLCCPALNKRCPAANAHWYPRL